MRRVLGRSRFLHWKRGLKQSLKALIASGRASLPSLEAWIETQRHRRRHSGRESLPSLEAWIETTAVDRSSLGRKVASFIGSVD